MVKFGRHVDALVEQEGPGLFIIPYNVIKGLTFIDEEGQQQTKNKNAFEVTWLENLEKASHDFQLATSSLWKAVFDKISSNKKSRGAVPEVAIALYAQEASKEATQELLVQLKQIHEAAYMNSEALRKLAKKYDKYNKDQLSPHLMPLLYTANFTTGQRMLEEGITRLRGLLGDDEDENVSDLVNHNFSDESHHEQLVEGRQAELEWLERLTSSMINSELKCLVAHRGFHSVQDYSHRRPIENSLAAYETAWTKGIHLCECDIALTKDEKLILAHDKDFSRLALDRSSVSSTKVVSELTFKELIHLPLTSGSRPPLLIDVLRSAHAIGESAQLIIEIKPGNEEAAEALARMLLDNPELISRVAVIMSLDAYTMHKLRQEFFMPPKQDARPIQGSPVQNKNTKERGDAQGEGLLTRNDRIAYPKLMLLTVSDPPKHSCELQVGIDDLSPIDSWMNSGDGCLDGVYMQFQTEMLEPAGAAALRNLSERYIVGVWTHCDRDPDDYDTFHTLVHESNVSFVNTDLPDNFRKGITLSTCTWRPRRQ